MPAPKSNWYHAILDLIDRNQFEVAAERLQDNKHHLSSQEFKLIINSFIRHGQSLRTA